MKKKMIMALTVMTIGATVMSGCGTSTGQEETETTEAADPAEDQEEDSSTENTQIANPWTESDEQGVAAATGFDMKAPDGATEVSYSYLEEDGLAQMTYVLEGADWNFRMQATDKLTDISGLSYDWTPTDGNVSWMAASYYGWQENDDVNGEGVQLVVWYDAVTGVDYSLSASGQDLNGMDIQVYAENIYNTNETQGEATDDPEQDQENELNQYFLGEHERSDDGSRLTITDNQDGTYNIALSITRLCDMENGVGTFADHKMTFEIEDPSGEKMTAMIYLDSDSSLAIKILDSTWTYLQTGDVIDGFGK